MSELQFLLVPTLPLDKFTNLGHLTLHCRNFRKNHTFENNLDSGGVSMQWVS